MRGPFFVVAMFLSVVAASTMTHPAKSASANGVGCAGSKAVRVAGCAGVKAPAGCAGTKVVQVSAPGVEVQVAAPPKVEAVAEAKPAAAAAPVADKAVEYERRIAILESEVNQLRAQLEVARCKCVANAQPAAAAPVTSTVTVAATPVAAPAPVAAATYYMWTDGSVHQQPEPQQPIYQPQSQPQVIYQSAPVVYQAEPTVTYSRQVLGPFGGTIYREMTVPASDCANGRCRRR